MPRTLPKLERGAIPVRIEVPASVSRKSVVATSAYAVLTLTNEISRYGALAVLGLGQTVNVAVRIRAFFSSLVRGVGWRISVPELAGIVAALADPLDATVLRNGSHSGLSIQRRRCPSGVAMLPEAATCPVVHISKEILAQCTDHAWSMSRHLRELLLSFEISLLVRLV